MWLKVLVQTITRAWPYWSRMRGADFDVKYSLNTSTPRSRASSDMLADGSTPSTRMPSPRHAARSSPSLLPMSTTSCPGAVTSFSRNWRARAEKCRGIVVLADGM